jgi:3-hydroxy-9,10-secoandrosta-1,3,5(10)-triene-9,17-dione monooxygenase reductase component
VSAPDARVDERALRRTLGTFVTGVTVMTTTGGDGSPVGVTANSFCSVSLRPPLVLWCLARDSSSLDNFTHAGGFAVNILGEHQAALSERFATRGHPNRFEDVAFTRGVDGAPLINGCAAHLQCRTLNVAEAGDHVIIQGEVVAISDWGRPSLVFSRGGYARLRPHPHMRPLAPEPYFLTAF